MIEIRAHSRENALSIEIALIDNGYVTTASDAPKSAGVYEFEERWLSFIILSGNMSRPYDICLSLGVEVRISELKTKPCVLSTGK